MLYKEYQSLKSKAHVGPGVSKSHFGTDSKKSVFGAHLNKKKPLERKKSLFCSTNCKTLGWSKHHGWTTFQNVPKNEHREINEVCTVYIFIYVRI